MGASAGLGWAAIAGRDARHALRTIGRMPGLAAVVVISLAIGIGVNTAVFSWIQAVMLKPLPGVSDATGFHEVEPRTETGGYPGVSWLEYRDLHDRLTSFQELMASRMVAFSVGEAGRPERTYGQLVSGNFFSALGLRPALGRFIRPDEVSRTGGEPVLVISYDFWQGHLAGAATALGQTVRVNNRPLTVIGVTPRGFQGTILGLAFDLWAPATLAPDLLGGSRELETRTAREYSVMGRLRPHVSEATAQADVDAVMRDLAHEYPATNGTLRADVLTFGDAPRGPQRFLMSALWILQAILLLLLLAVCGNTANLVLARASARHREIGVRLALGARRWRIVSLLLTENLILGLMGAAAGAAIAVWGTEALRAMPAYGAMPIRFQTSVDATGLAFALLLGAGCGVIFGLAPALHLGRIDPQQALRSGARTAGRSRMRNALMAIQVAVALIVLLVAGLFLKSFGDSRDADPGFRRDGLLLAAYDLTGRNLDASVTRDFTRRLLDRLRSLPAVEAAAIAASVPLDIHGLPIRSFALEGRARGDGRLDEALSNIVTSDYLKTMGIPLVAGRDFVALDETAAPPQAIVNEAFVRRYLGAAEPMASAIGRRLDAGTRRYTIIGVARNSVYNAFGEAPTAIVYYAYRDRGPAYGQMHLRTRAGGETLVAAAVRGVVRDLDPSLPVYDVRTMNEHVGVNMMFRRIPARMFLVLGPLLLLLAAIGISAVVAYTVSQRTTEIGLRLALGATGRRVVTQLVADTMRVIGVGALAGWLIAVFVAFDVIRSRSIDLPVFLAVPALLLLVAACACWIPARRASRVDPLVALRHE